MKTSTIRDATLADLDQLTGILHQFHEDRGTASNLQQARAAVGTCIGDSRSNLIVANLDGEIIGYAAVHWIPFPMLQGHEAYVSDLLIRREWRGRGVGHRLLAAIEERARERGCVRIMLNNLRTAESFTRGFFTKAGFHERADFANFVKPVNW